MRSILRVTLFMAVTAFAAGCCGQGIDAPPVETPNADYTLKVNGKNVYVYDCRVSAVPLNQVWPGYQRPIDQTEIAAFAWFEVPEGGKKNRIEIESANPVESVRVSPESAGIKPEIDGNKISFVMDKPLKVAVEVNGHHKALHLFADLPETDAPSLETPGLLYYGPGVHDVGNVMLESNQEVYLAPGSLVFGNFIARNAENIRIYGRGILDGSKLERGNGCATDFYQCSGIRVEGIIFRDPNAWTCAFFHSRDVVVDNIKMVGLWRYNADGIDIVNTENVVVKNCFLRTFDDGIVVKGMANHANPDVPSKPVRNILAHDNVVWCDWNKALEIGAETSAPVMEDITFRDIDIIRTAHVAMDILHGDSAIIRNVLFENIRLHVDDYTPHPVIQKEKGEVYADIGEGKFKPTLFILDISKNMWAQDDGLGPLSDVTYRNIAVTGAVMPSSYFQGADEQHKVSNVTIENLTFNGKPITNAEEAELRIGAFVENVVFK